MKYADKLGAGYTMVLGDNELQEGKAELKNMKTGEKRKISIGEDFIDAYLTASTAQDDLSAVSYTHLDIFGGYRHGCVRQDGGRQIR